MTHALSAGVTARLGHVMHWLTRRLGTRQGPERLTLPQGQAAHPVRVGARSSTDPKEADATGRARSRAVSACEHT